MPLPIFQNVGIMSRNWHLGYRYISSCVQNKLPEIYLPSDHSSIPMDFTFKANPNTTINNNQFSSISLGVTKPFQYINPRNRKNFPPPNHLEATNLVSQLPYPSSSPTPQFPYSTYVRTAFLYTWYHDAPFDHSSNTPLPDFPERSRRPNSERSENLWECRGWGFSSDKTKRLDKLL